MNVGQECSSHQINKHVLTSMSALETDPLVTRDARTLLAVTNVPVGLDSIFIAMDIPAEISMSVALIHLYVAISVKI